MQSHEHEAVVGRRLPDELDALWSLMQGTGLLRATSESTPNVPERSERTKHIASELRRVYREHPDKGLRPEGFVFACITADMGLWDQLAAHDPRMADALLAYYSTDTHGPGLVESVPGLTHPQSVGRLLKRARDYLWNALPDHPTLAFPYQKEVVFPPERLLKSPPGGAEANRRWWSDPAWRQQAEERLRRIRERQAAYRRLHGNE